MLEIIWVQRLGIECLGINMPWNIRRSGSQYEVVQQNNGKVVGRHATRESAQRQMAALYANEPEAAKGTEQPVRNNWQGQFFPTRR